MVDLCLSPKSNSAYLALDAAIADIRAGNAGEIPDYLRDSQYEGAKSLNRAASVMNTRIISKMPGATSNIYLTKLNMPIIMNQNLLANMNKPLPSNTNESKNGKKQHDGIVIQNYIK